MLPYPFLPLSLSLRISHLHQWNSPENPLRVCLRSAIKLRVEKLRAVFSLISVTECRYTCECLKVTSFPQASLFISFCFCRGLSIEMKYPIRCVWCLSTSIYWNLKEPTSNSLAFFNSSVGSLYSVSSKTSLFQVKVMEKDKVREEERRRKIGLANKGKVPWNKGIKHTQDTRRRIKERTIEALRNPKVRDKMSEHQQPHSDETKEKIRASMKQIWAERSRSKRLKEMFTLLWAESIAGAAREGGSGEVELDWDSYEKAELEISSEQQFQLAEEKARAKEERAEEAAQAKTEKKMRRVVERKKERQERDQRGGKTRKPKQNKENATTTSRSKLKKRLTKIHKKKTSLGKIAIGKDRVVSIAAKLEKLDLELIRKERTRGDISLADQIQAAKNQRGNDFSSRFGLFAMKSMDFD